MPQEPEQEEENAVELPPPMKEIQNPTDLVQSASAANTTPKVDYTEPTKSQSFGNSLTQNDKKLDLAEIEQIVKEKVVRIANDDVSNINICFSIFLKQKFI